MEYVRQIVNGNSLEPLINLPPSFHDVQVEVIVFHVNDAKAAGYYVPEKPVSHSTFGRLQAFANPSLIPEEESAWEEEAAVEKYAVS